MSKKHLESPPEEAGETAPDEQLKRETEILKLIAGETEYGYPPTRYRTMHPDEVDPSDFAKMSDKELNDYLVALDIVLDYRAIPQGRSIITALTN